MSIGTTDAAPGSTGTRRVAPKPFRGFYINLDRSTARRDALARQFATMGMAARYQRFPAVDGGWLQRSSPLKPGELGCFASHLALIEKAARGSGVVHILEDDAVLSPVLPEVVARLEEGGVFTTFDVVFSEMMVIPNIEWIKTLKAKFDAATAGGPGTLTAVETLDLAAVNFAGATSYLITPRGAERLLPLLRREWEAGPTLPVDLFIRQETHQGRIRAACLFPFLSTIDLAEVLRSTLGRNDPVDPVLILAMLRYAFFVGADFSAVAPDLLAAVEGRAGTDPRRGFLAALLGLVISDRFHIV